jgi:hypothetical protein
VDYELSEREGTIIDQEMEAECAAVAGAGDDIGNIPKSSIDTPLSNVAPSPRKRKPSVH